MAVLLAPVAAAKPGNGNGHSGSGHGPRAGRRRQRCAKAHGKPASSGKGQEKKAEKAAQRDARKAAREAEGETPADGPKHDNPAWVCKFERDQMGGDAFAERYGTNESKANAFGMCVSTEAHDRDGVSAGSAGAEEPADDETTVPTDAGGEDPAGEDPAGEDARCAARVLRGADGVGVLDRDKPAAGARAGCDGPPASPALRVAPGQRPPGRPAFSRTVNVEPAWRVCRLPRQGALTL